MGAFLKRLTTGRRLAGLAALLLVGSGAAAAAAASGAVARTAALSGGAAALMTVLAFPALSAVARRHLDRMRMSVARAFVEHDAAPAFCVDASGAIFAMNRAARDRFDAHRTGSMKAVLGGLVADPGGVVGRMLHAAESKDGAREEVATRTGSVRLAVRAIPGGHLWRVEDIADGAPPPLEEDDTPALAFDTSDAVRATNAALRARLGKRPARLEDAFANLPVTSGGVNALRAPDGERPVRMAVTAPVGGIRTAFALPADGLAGADAALDALPVAFLRLDPFGVIQYANAPARRLIPAAATPGLRLDALVEGLGRPVAEWVADATDGRGLGRPEMMRVTDASVDTFLQITLGRTPGREADGLVAVLSDATELKTLEAQFVQSQKMQAIGQLAGGVAHDFNNLLTAITGHCDLLLLRHREGDESWGDLMQITQNANRAGALVGQLLAFSRKQTLQLAHVDLRETLGELAHLLNRLVGDRVRLSVDHDRDLPAIRCDKRQLEQVLMNLVVNARDAMPDGGTISIDTRRVTLDAPLVRDRATVPSGLYVVVSVRDEGVGIPSDKLRRIFEPFFTTKRPGEGTGLGLSMAYGIVKQSGGYIFAESSPGRGAVFQLYFPAASAARNALVPPSTHPPSAEVARAVPGGPPEGPADGRDGAAPDAQGALGGASAEHGGVSEGRDAPGPDHRHKTVLLVEDEAPIRSFASRALRLKGYTVIEARCAEEALERLEDESLHVDLFVTDVMMPGLDGPTWVNRALERRPGVRTVFISGYSNDALDKGQDRTPDSVFLAKPFSLAELTRTVETVLH